MEKSQCESQENGRKKLSGKKKLQAKIEGTDAYHLYYEPYLYILDLRPLEAIQEHAKAVNDTVSNMKYMFHAYLEGHFDKADTFLPKVKESEFRADNIKSIIRDKLPRSFFSGLTKDSMNTFLKELDAVADSAEDVADYLAVRRTEIPEEIKIDFKKHIGIVSHSVNILFNAIKHLDQVKKGMFRKKDVDGLLQKLHCVAIAEHEADKIKMKIRKTIFNLKDHDPIAVYHMLKLLQFSDAVADHAENVEGRIRMIAGHGK